MPVMCRGNHLSCFLTYVAPINMGKQLQYVVQPPRKTVNVPSAAAADHDSYYNDSFGHGQT
jgi:hypothetical protein